MRIISGFQEQKRRICPSLQGDIFLEIPSRHGGTAAKYLGFIPLNSLESATCTAKAKYLAASEKGSRYRLEEMDMAGSQVIFAKEAQSN